MKQVFNTSEVAHIWAQQNQKSGRNPQKNLYFEGATIYSYGGHFPIATIRGNDVFFTLKSYSNTTAKHIQKVWQAISHKNIIWVHEVPVYFDYLTQTHSKNIDRWGRDLKAVFAELGNKRIRDTQSRINSAMRVISELETYCNYFKLPVKDKELKSLIQLAKSPEFVTKAREAKEKETAATLKKLKQGEKAHQQYINLWREYKDEEIKNLPDKVKDLCNFYAGHQQSFTRLRYNAAQNRVETSKGVQIPAEIAKRAYFALNGCLNQSCNDLSIPVLDYTIEKTTETALIAGCHTIPKTDVQYIANLLKW